MGLMTWGPFQSPEVREICEHMTAEEKRKINIRGGLYGLWVFATLAWPVSFGMIGAIRKQSLPLFIFGVTLIVIHIACIPFWQKKQREFLCSTQWAREQGFTRDQIRLFDFKKQ